MTGSENAAHMYDAEPSARKTRTWQDAQRDLVDAVLDAAGIKEANKLLDLGCGYGGTAMHVARRLGCQAVGVNISPFQVQAANQLAAKEGFKPQDMSFVVGDAQAPDMEEASFDLVLSQESACYMPDKTKFIAQMSRLVTPGGTVILLDFCRADGPPSAELQQPLARMDATFATAGSWHSASEYYQLMAANGLTIVCEETWTKNISGFWNQGLFSLLFRNAKPGQSVWRWLLEVQLRMWTCLWLMLTGGLEVLKLAVSFLLGVQKRVVQGGLDNGGIEYRLIAATRPFSLV